MEYPFCVESKFDSRRQDKADYAYWGCTPEPPKIPSTQIQPGQERIQVDHLATTGCCTPKSTKISEIPVFSASQHFLTVLAQRAVRTKMPVKGLARDPQLLA